MIRIGHQAKLISHLGVNRILVCIADPLEHGRFTGIRPSDNKDAKVRVLGSEFRSFFHCHGQVGRCWRLISRRCALRSRSEHLLHAIEKTLGVFYSLRRALVGHVEEGRTAKICTCFSILNDMFIFSVEPLATQSKMLEYLVSRLLCLYIELLAFLMPPSFPTQMDPIKSDSVSSVASYLGWLKCHLKLADNPFEELLHQQVNRLRLVKVVQRRTEHEYLLAQINIHDDVHCFRVERSRGLQSTIHFG